MAEVAFLHYRPGRTVLHRLPGTVKLLLLIGSSILAYQLPPVGLIPLGLLLAVASLAVRPRFNKMAGPLIFALGMAALLALGHYHQSDQALESILRAGRFLLIYCLGILITTVTDPEELGDAFYTLTRWLPLFPAKRLRTLVTLTLLFLPLIMDESLTLERASRSRCLNKRKSPVHRIKYRAAPLLEGILRKSEEISRAMAARCYRE